MLFCNFTPFVQLNMIVLLFRFYFETLKKKITQFKIYPFKFESKIKHGLIISLFTVFTWWKRWGSWRRRPSVLWLGTDTWTACTRCSGWNPAGPKHGQRHWRNGCSLSGTAARCSLCNDSQPRPCHSPRNSPAVESNFKDLILSIDNFLSWPV